MKIYVCTNKRPLSGQPSCGGRGSEELIALMEHEISLRGADLQIKTSVCMGHCEKGPNIKVAGQATRHEMDQIRVYQLLDELVRI